MTNNCLVTKLKENVDNNLLPQLGSLIFKITLTKTANRLIIARPFYDNVHIVTFRILQGNAFFADTFEAESGTQSVQAPNQENKKTVYLHGNIGDTIYISIDNYYYLACFDAVEDSNVPGTWPIIEMDWDLLKYSKIYHLFVRPNEGEELEIGTLNFLSQSLSFASDHSFITFDKTKATSNHAPDILTFTIFKTIDMAIDALIYYKDKYSGYYNGPYYSTIPSTPFANIPADKKAAVYDALYYPLANADNPNNLRQIYFGGSTYKVSNGELLENGTVVPNPNN